MSTLPQDISFLKFLSIAFVRQLSSGRSLKALEVSIRPLQVALRKILQMDARSEAASRLRHSMQAFATIQLFRLQYGEHHENFAGIQTKLPPASLELSLWLIRVLAEDGRKMFSHLTVRAINFALWKHLCIIIHAICWQKVFQNFWIGSNPPPPFYQKFHLFIS